MGPSIPTTSNTITLDPVAVVGSEWPQGVVIQSEVMSTEPEWVTVELQGAHPFSLQVEWSAGGSSRNLMLSAGTGVHFSLLARSLKVTAFNQINQTNEVSANLALGQVIHRDLHHTPLYGIQLNPGDTNFIEIPPFASRIQLHRLLFSGADESKVRVSFLAWNGGIEASYTLDNLPKDMLLGHYTRVQVDYEVGAPGIVQIRPHFALNF